MPPYFQASDFKILLTADSHKTSLKIIEVIFDLLKNEYKKNLIKLLGSNWLKVLSS